MKDPAIVRYVMQATQTPSGRSKWHPMRMAATTVVLSCGLIAACTADADQVRPPGDQLFFPTGIVVAESAGVAFVANANSELRFDSGTLTVLDLDVIDQITAAWTQNLEVPTGVDGDGDPVCAQDLDHGETLACDEGLFIRDRAGVRIGNFATDLSLQDLGGGALRLVVPTRGDPSIAWADWDGERLSCNGGSETNSLCDDEHRLSYLLNDADQAGIPEEPFSAFADSAGEFALVTHLSSGAVTLIDSPRSGLVQISDVLGGVFAADSTTGLRGATGVVGRLPNAANDIIYVGSRSEDRIQMFTVGRPVNGAPPFLIPGGWFFLDVVGSNAGNSRDTRGMTFNADGSRLYLANRRPPSLQIYNTELGAGGYPLNQPAGATDICRQASTVALAGSGDDERAYVTCFQDGLIYVVDPNGRVGVEDIVLVGRGPYGVAAARTRNKLFVTNFLEDTIAVVDIAPGSPTRNRVVLRIGKSRAL